MKKNYKYRAWYAHAFKKTFLVMRLVLVISLLCIMQSFALESYTQNSKISISVKEMKLDDILMKLESETNFRFAYNKTDINVNQVYTIDVNDAQIKEVLDKLFADKDISYKIIDQRQIILSKLNSAYTVSQQQISISGKVTDSSGQPLPGVSVVVKGTTTGTITDFDGKYTLTNVPGDATLVFSFVGMKTQEIPVSGKSVINITLAEETVGIEEVVAVGYGTQKRVNLTGSVGTLSSEALESRPVQNATQMLQGLVPGLIISQNNGGLESRPSINIRGIATIGEGSTGNPLILIDGMEGSINAINPQDIQDISVLKDAAASSIYGSRASFGVILVTTKSGRSGKTTINYNNSFRWNCPINVPNMMNSFDFATYFNDANVNQGNGPYFSAAHVQRIKDYMDGKITTTNIPHAVNPINWGTYNAANANEDWYGIIFKDQSFSQEHNVNFSGGSEKLQYYLSGNYLDQDGLMKLNQDNFKRYTTTIKLSAHINEWLTLNANSRFIREDNIRPQALTDQLFYDLARQGWPNLPLYDPNGYIFSSPSPALKLRDGGHFKTQRDWLYQQFQLAIEPVKGWKTFVEFNYQTRNDFIHMDILQTYNHDVAGNPYLFDNLSSSVLEKAFRENQYTCNIYSEYSKEFKSGHNFKGMVGFQSELDRYREFSARTNGIIVPELPVIDVSTGTNYLGNVMPPTVTGEYQHWSTTGYFGRINYDFKGRYLIETNLRYDGTSRFRADKRWQLFPSFSAGWNIAREKFWSRYENVINTLKLRASYGSLGNQNTQNLYPTYVTMPVGTSNGTWLINGLKPNTSDAPGLVSRLLSWERIRSWNLALDMGMFTNRLRATLEYYTRFTDDMVGPAPELPVILGTGVPKTNNTNLKTYGTELDINWNDKLNNGLTYGVHLTMFDSQTKILDYPNPTGSLSTYRSGQMFDEIWGFETIGIAKSQEEMDAHLASLPNGAQNAIGSQWAAGDIMYRDLNNDGKISKGASTESDHGDLKIIGNKQPRYNFGIDLHAEWKGLDFRAFFQGIMKRDYFQDSYYFWGAYSYGLFYSTGFEEHKDYFRAGEDHVFGQNLDAYFPRPMFSKSAKNQQIQSRYLQDASYIRLKNLQIGYNLPQSLLNRANIKKLRIFVSGENLWTGTKMIKIFDPETIDGGYKNNGKPNGNVYPLLKVYSVGLSVNL